MKKSYICPNKCVHGQHLAYMRPKEAKCHVKVDGRKCGAVYCI